MGEKMQTATTHLGTSNVQDTINLLTALASETFRKFQVHYKRNPDTYTAEARLLSQALKELCIKLHGLGLRCSELDEEGCQTLNRWEEAPRLKDCKGLLLRIDVLLKQHSELYNADKSQGALTVYEMETIRAELILHRTYMSAAQVTSSLEDLAKILSTEIASGSHGPSSSQENGTLLPIRICPEQSSSDSLKRFQSDDMLQRALRHPKASFSDHFLTSATFKAWRDEPASVLWVTSSSRAGNTVMTGSIIRSLVQGMGSNTAVCYFFAKSPSAIHKKPLQLIMGIIGQLAHQDVRAYEIIERSQDEPFRLTPKGLCGTARKALSCFDHVSLVIEGLDTYAEKLPQILSLLSSILAGTIHRLGSTEYETDVSLLVLSSKNEIISDFINAPPYSSHDSPNEVSGTLEPVMTESRIVMKSPRLRPMKSYLRWESELDYATSTRHSEIHPTTTSRQFSSSILKLSKEVESRCAECLIYASSEMDRLLTVYIAHFKTRHIEALPVSTSTIDVNELEVLHSNLVDFVNEVTHNQELPPNTESHGERSLSMAIFCLRYLCLPQFGITPFKEFRLEKQRICRRDQEHPFYRFAAVSWIHLSKDHWGDEQLLESASQLFDPVSSANFQQWVVEFARNLFPCDIGFQALSSKPFMELVSMLSGNHGLRLNVAASMGLHRLCATLIEQKACIDDTSVLGTPIYCALAGPAALISPWVHVNVLLDHLQLEKVTETCAEQRATISLLLDKEMLSAQDFVSRSDGIPICSLSLIVCSRLRAADLFFCIIVSDVKFDNQFLFFFERGYFLAELYATNATEDEIRIYLNSLFKGLAKMTLSFIGYTKEEKAFDVYEAIWSYTQAHKLDWCENLQQHHFAIVSDEDFNEYVQHCMMESSNAIRYLSKDPRFNPNAVCQKGQPLLHKARNQGLDLVKLLAEVGADLSIRDTADLTLAHLCAREAKIDILQYLVKSGVDMTLLTTKSAGNPKRGDGQNVWHCAAEAGPMVFDILVDHDPANEQALFAVSDTGSTPLADLLWKLETLSEESDKSAQILHAIRTLRKIAIKDSRLFQSTTPIFHVAALLGSTELLQAIQEMGAELCLDPGGSSPLHYCRVTAGLPYIQHVKKLCENLPWENAMGRTPLESIIFERHDGKNDPLPVPVILELLYRKVNNIDHSEDHGLWERICTDAIPRLATVPSSHRSNFILPILDYLIFHGLLRRFEDESKVCGAKLLFKGLSNADRVPLCLATMMQRVLEETIYPKTLGDDDSVITGLKWAIRINHHKLVKSMLEHGAPGLVHMSTFDISALQFGCLSASSDKFVFNILLDYADSSRLNDLSGNQGPALMHLLLKRDVNDREDKLRALLAKGADPDLRSETGNPALIMFLVENYTKCVEILLEFGADPTAKNKDGMDIALATTFRGKLALLKLIHDNKKIKVDWTATCLIKIKVLRPDGTLVVLELVKTNALHLAALYGFDAILEFYLTNGLLEDIEAVSPAENLRPIHYACLGGSSACIRMLADRGADIRSRTSDGSSCLHVAVRAQHLGAVNTLIELGLGNDLLDNWGFGPLAYAVRQASKNISNALLSASPASSGHCITPNADGFSNSKKRLLVLSTALDAAIRQNSLDLCRRLWAYGCSLVSPVPSCHGCTPIMAALRLGRVEIAKWILSTSDLKSNPSSLNGQRNRDYPSGIASLQIACGIPQCNRILVDLLNVYLETGSNWLQWPLGVFHFCATTRNVEAVKIVLKYTNENEDKLRAAFRDLPKDVGHWLLNQRISVKDLKDPYFEGLTPLHVAIMKDSYPIAEYLVTAGADVNQTDLYRNTPLHIAIKENRDPIARLLIESGCEIECRDDAGYTPIMRATEEGAIDIVRLLVDKGADISSQEFDGMSLINIAGDSSGSPAVFQYLLQLGLDPYRADSAGYYAVHDAIFDPEFTTYIMNSGLDFYQACGRNVFSRLLTLAVEMNGILPRLIRRIPKEYLPFLIDIHPPRHSSPLCNAARRGNLNALKLLIQYGADLEFEGCDDGTAVMAACRAGHLDIVRHLARSGCQISYTKDGRVRSAMLAGVKFRPITRWLLVDRWTEQQALCQAGDQHDSVDIKSWSGMVMVEVELNGVGARYGRAWQESMKDYMGRLAALRHSLRGRVIHPTRWH